MISPEFVIAGRAVFTVHNANNEHYTFKVTHKEASGKFQETWFVNLLTGPDNTSDYTYIGMMDKACNFRLTKGSKLSEDSKPVKVFKWAMKVIGGNSQLPEGYGIKHEGACGRCGRALTVPESLDNGIGPECMKIMGLAS